MKFSREFYFHASYFRAPPICSFSRKTNFRTTVKKVWFYQTKTSRMLVCCLYLVREKTTTQNMSFKNRAILFSHTFSCANHSNSHGLYIRAGALRENKTHSKFHELRFVLCVHASFLCYTQNNNNNVCILCTH